MGWCTGFSYTLKTLLFSLFFFSSRRRHTRYIGDWSSDVCSSDLTFLTLIVVPVLFTLLMRDRSGPEVDVEAELASGSLPGAGATPVNPRGAATDGDRSEERRVGKECGAGWWGEGYGEETWRQGSA